MSEPQTRRPRAFRLPASEGGVAAPATALPDAPVIIENQPDVFILEAHGALPAGEAAVEIAQRRGVMARGWSWGALFWSALGAFISLAFGVWFDSLIEGFFARAPTLGWIGLGLLALVLVALAALATRELRGIFRQRHIALLHQALALARADDDRNAARAHVRDLTQLYAGRPETAAVRANLGDLTEEIVDGRDLIDIAERDLIHPLDTRAQREIALAARRVSVITTISPRALVDVLVVAAQAVRLIRRIAEIYGGRPGLLGLVRLLRSVGAHIAITAGMAVGDSLVQQALGHGIAAKLSARLGEGVLNGMLTTRVGLSAMAVCRPMPFAVEKAPGVRDVAPFLFRPGGESSGNPT